MKGMTRGLILGVVVATCMGASLDARAEVCAEVPTFLQLAKVNPTQSLVEEVCRNRPRKNLTYATTIGQLRDSLTSLQETPAGRRVDGMIKELQEKIADLPASKPSKEVGFLRKEMEVMEILGNGRHWPDLKGETPLARALGSVYREYGAQDKREEDFEGYVGALLDVVREMETGKEALECFSKVENKGPFGPLAVEPTRQSTMSFIVRDHKGRYLNVAGVRALGELVEYDEQGNAYVNRAALQRRQAMRQRLGGGGLPPPPELAGAPKYSPYMKVNTTLEPHHIIEAFVHELMHGCKAMEILTDINRMRDAEADALTRKFFATGGRQFGGVDDDPAFVEARIIEAHNRAVDEVRAYEVSLRAFLELARAEPGLFCDWLVRSPFLGGQFVTSAERYAHQEALSRSGEWPQYMITNYLEIGAFEAREVYEWNPVSGSPVKDAQGRPKLHPRLVAMLQKEGYLPGAPPPQSGQVLQPPAGLRPQSRGNPVPTFKPNQPLFKIGQPAAKPGRTPPPLFQTGGKPPAASTPPPLFKAGKKPPPLFRSKSRK